jgi:hypothetical protein
LQWKRFHFCAIFYGCISCAIHTIHTH